MVQPIRGWILGYLREALLNGDLEGLAVFLIIWIFRTLMSYDIFFYRLSSDEVTADSMDGFLESDEFGKDEHVISKETMFGIKDMLLEKGLKFEILENKHGCELALRFGNYFVSMYPGEIAISIPYHKENSEESIMDEIRLISETIVGKGLLGYDPQTGALITEKDGLRLYFAETEEAIQNTISQFYPQTEEPKNFWERLLKYIQSGVERNIRWWAFQTLIIIVGITLIIIYEYYFK